MGFERQIQWWTRYVSLQSRRIAEQEKRAEYKRDGIARKAWTIAQLTSQIAVGSPASYLDAADGLTLLLTAIHIQLTQHSAAYDGQCLCLSLSLSLSLAAYIHGGVREVAVAAGFG